VFIVLLSSSKGNTSNPDYKKGLFAFALLSAFIFVDLQHANNTYYGYNSHNTLHRYDYLQVPMRRSKPLEMGIHIRYNKMKKLFLLLDNSEIPRKFVSNNRKQFFYKRG
jgi:hypothetical protein